MISVSDEAIRSQPDFRFSFDCRLADVLVAGSASSSRQCASCFRDARSSFGLEMVPSQSAEMIRRECNGDFSPTILQITCGEALRLILHGWTEGPQTWSGRG